VLVLDGRRSLVLGGRPGVGVGRRDQVLVLEDGQVLVLERRPGAVEGRSGVGVGFAAGLVLDGQRGVDVGRTTRCCCEDDTGGCWGGRPGVGVGRRPGWHWKGGLVLVLGGLSGVRVGRARANSVGRTTTRWCWRVDHVLCSKDHHLLLEGRPGVVLGG
jgi:hypothetical protein